MFRSWKLGTLFGIGIHVHPTFLLLPILVVAGSQATGLSSIVFLLALVAAVFGCVVLHELGHALMARRFGIRTVDITLYPIGGVARLERLTERPSEELWIALAGPAVNVAIFLLLTPLVIGGPYLAPRTVVDEALVLPGAWGPVLSFLTSLWMANAMLVLFNLMPTFPMDGGRVLRALLAMRWPLPRATEIAVTVGRVFMAAALVLLTQLAPGYLTNHPLLLVLVVFVFLAGAQELAAIRHREAQKQGAAEVVPLVEPVGTVPPGFTGVTYDARTGAGVKWYDGRPVGYFAIPPQ